MSYLCIMVVEYDSGSLVIRFTSKIEKEYFKDINITRCEKEFDKSGFYGYKLIFESDGM